MIAYTQSLKQQSGVALLEALIAILLVAFGILGIVGVQATSVAAVADARYRVEAIQLADELISQIWVDTTPLPESGPGGNVLPAYANNASALPEDWLARVHDRLPGSEENPPLIAAVANNVITLTIRWRPPNGDLHQHIIVTAVNRS